MFLSELKPTIINVLESIYVVNKEVKITKQHDRASSDTDTISTFFRKNPYESRIRGSVPIYSVLNYLSSDESTAILSSLKGSGPYKVNETQINQFIDGVVDACKKFINEFQPDVIIYPKSRSELLKQFVNKLNVKYPKIQIADEAFVKKVLKAGDEEALINTEHPAWKKFTEESPKSVDELKKNLAKQVKDGQLEFKKLYKPYLKFIKNFIELKDAAKTLDYVIGKRILVIDDILSSGATMLEMFRQLQEFEPDEISGLTIFKRTNEVLH